VSAGWQTRGGAWVEKGGVKMKQTIRFAGVLAVLLSTILVGPVYADDGSVYIVQPGDTLLQIAARYGLTATQLAVANGLRWNSWVYVGQRLRIPGAGTGAVAATASSVAPGGTYVVRAGDSLIAIAARHGVSVSQLALANGLSTSGWVYVGQRLKIPGGSSAPTTPAPAPTAVSPGAPADRAPSSSSWPAARSVPVTHPGGTYVVRAGDTLLSIAARHKVTVGDLARANGMYSNSWVYTGQQLKIPGGSSASTSTTPSSSSTSSAPAASPGGTYVVRPGDSLTGIATRHAVSVSRLAAVNGLQVSSWVYVGQRLQIPDGSSTTSVPSTTTTTPSNPPAPAPSGASGKWIDVNLTTQTLTAFEGQTPVLTALVSTGTWRTPTVVGTFSIYVKYTSTRMRGPGYDLPNVPYTMYFYRGYGLHGTYWHNNFGTPMSHGCVNLSTPNAQWLFNWAPLGTKVVTHY
jgi:LysM repeat protein